MSNYENIRPYAEFSHDAAQDGGIDNHLNNIKNEAREQGVEEGRLEILRLIPVFFVLFQLIWKGLKILANKAKAIYCEHRAKKQAPLKKKAEESEAVLREEIKRVEESESQELMSEYSEEES